MDGSTAPRTGPAAWLAAARGATPVRRALSGAVVVLVLAALCVVLAACGNNGLSLARQACVQVNASITLYDRSLHASPARAARDQERAIEDLEAALPIAAQANGADAQWNPLMTTLQEVGRNSEAHLVAALRAQCDQAAQPDEEAPVVSPDPAGATTTSATPSTLPGQ